MTRRIGTLLKDQGRGIVGALIVSIKLLFTMEMWWTGWQLPKAWLVGYSVVGLASVLALVRTIGFRADEAARRTSVRVLATDFTEVLLQSFVTAYLVLLLFGVIDVGDAPVHVLRLGLLFVVPLGFGAALANALLAAEETEQDEDEWPLTRRIGVFAVGAVFVSMTLAPTDEMPLMAASASWVRLALVVILSVLVAYLVLFELEFQGHARRTADRTLAGQVGSSVMAYTVGAVVAVSLLAAFGQFRGAPFTVWIQLTVVLGLPASVGASGARVVLG